MKYEVGDKAVVVENKDDSHPLQDYVNIGTVVEIIDRMKHDFYNYKVLPQGGEDEEAFWVFEDELGGCEDHGEAVYHDRLEKWICPFCYDS